MSYISNSIIVTAKIIGDSGDIIYIINCIKYENSSIIQTRINRNALLRINRLKCATLLILLSAKILGGCVLDILIVIPRKAE